MNKILFSVFLLFTQSLWANADLDELQSIVESKISQQAIYKSFHQNNLEGTHSVSMDQSMMEIMATIDRCRHEPSLQTKVHTDDEIKTFAVSCKINESDILVSEALIKNDEEKTIKSYQELHFRESFLTPKAYLKLLSQYEVEKVQTDETSSSGMRTLGTFARAGIPVALSFQGGKLLFPDRVDWQKHFIAGSIISGVTILTVQGILRFIGKKTGRPMSERKITIISSVAGLLMSIVAGAGKEIYDRRSGRGTPEFRDALFTAAGGAFVSLVFNIPFGRLFGLRLAPI